MVESLWQEPRNRIGLCVLSMPELKGRLTVEVDDPEEVDRAVRQYVDELTTILIVDRRTADGAMLLRESTDTRLPLVDAVIAGCAHVHSAVLVHRDPHMASIPRELVIQMVLAEKDTSTEPPP